LSECRFANNSAARGAALYCSGSSKVKCSTHSVVYVCFSAALVHLQLKQHVKADIQDNVKRKHCSTEFFSCKLSELDQIYVHVACRFLLRVVSSWHSSPGSAEQSTPLRAATSP
jgi:predicted outer membrane repeat protein